MATVASLAQRILKRRKKTSGGRRKGSTDVSLWFVLVHLYGDLYGDGTVPPNHGSPLRYRRLAVNAALDQHSGTRQCWRLRPSQRSPAGWTSLHAALATLNEKKRRCSPWMALISALS